MSTNILPGLDPPYISRNLQANHSQRFNYHHRSCLHPYHERSRRSSKSSSQSYSLPHSQSRLSPVTLRPQQPYARHSDPSYDRLYTPTVNHSGVISVSVPPRYPVNDREREDSLKSSPSSYPRLKQTAPLILHAPQPMRHPDMLNPGLSASPRA
jgi:hypothetical protein